MVSTISLIVSLHSSPEYDPIIVQMDSIESERSAQTDHLIQTGQKEITNRLDSMDKRLEEIRVKHPQ